MKRKIITLLILLLIFYIFLQSYLLSKNWLLLYANDLSVPAYSFVIILITVLILYVIIYLSSLILREITFILLFTILFGNMGLYKVLYSNCVVNKISYKLSEKYFLWDYIFKYINCNSENKIHILYFIFFIVYFLIPVLIFIFVKKYHKNIWKILDNKFNIKDYLIKNKIK